MSRGAEAEAHFVRMCRLGRMRPGELAALLGGEAAEIAPFIESAARYGFAEAQLRLGQLLLDGTGLAKDEAAALRWFGRAADRGLPEAMNMLGRCLENGWGAPADLAGAAHWYRRSAEAGSAWGQYNLAGLLFDGRGAPRDRAAALGWYGRAAAQGHGRAMCLLARSLEEGWGAPPDLARAAYWRRRSAEAGYFRGQFNYGAWLADLGEVAEALPWLELALAGSTPASSAVMAGALAGHPDPRLAALGRRYETDGRARR